MKILYINKVSPLTPGGAELRLRELTTRLASRGHEVRVLCGRNFPDLPARQVIDGVEVRNVKVLPPWAFKAKTLSFFLARYLFYFLSLSETVRAVREADVVVDCATPTAGGAAPVSRLLGKPCAVTIYEAYGRNWFKMKGPVTATLGRLGEAYFFTQTYDAYITLSRQTAAAIAEGGKPPERIHHLHHGVGVYRPERPINPVEERASEVACVSRLTKQKNVSSLLRAWRMVTDEMPGLRLRIVGDGSERANLEKLAKALSVSGSVTFEGRATEERKWELLEGASAFAFPSLQEGFGIVALEAMAAGLPVVAYDLPVFREFMDDGEHGYLVPPGDEERMAERLLGLLGDEPLRREIGRRNSRHAEGFNWERATDQEEEVLLGVLARRRGERDGA